MSKQRPIFLRLLGLFCCLAALAIAAWLGVAAPALAAEPAAGAAAPTLPESLTREEVRDVVSRLSDAEVRAVLIQQLDKVAAATAAAEPPVQTLEDVLPAAQGRFNTLIAAAPRLAEVGPIAVNRLSGGEGIARFGLVLAFTVLLFVAGALVESGFRRLFSQIGGAEDAEAPFAVIDRLCILGMRLLRDLLAIAVFGAVVVALFLVLPGNYEPVRVLVSNVFWGVIVFRLIAAALRFGLAPYAPRLRIPDLSDARARTIYNQGRFIVATVILGYCSGLILVHLVEDPGLQLLITIIIMLAVIAVSIGFVWWDRRPVAEAILGETGAAADASRIRKLLAANWHVFVSALLVLMVLIAIGRLLLVGEGVGATIIASLAILALVPALDWGLRAIVCALLRIPGPYGGPYAGRLAEPVVAAPAATPAAALRDAASTESAVPEASGDAAAAAAEHARVAERDRAARRAYHDVLIKNLRIVLAVVVAVLLADIWDIDLQAVAAAKVGATLAGSLFDIMITLILASAFWGIIKVAIRSAVPEGDADSEDTEAGEIGGKGKSRLETLVPLLGKFLLVTLVVIVALIILSELGVDIGPLIAGAGVIGLAIGFGAQTLVRDIISGLFFLLDDAFRVGEYVVVGSVRGMVEHISIRSLRLRHHNGPVHTIPFGEVQTLTNFSRDWAIMKLELRIPFDTDLEKVRKIIKRTGQELMDDPEHGPNFLQPLKSQGVNRMDDSAFIVRVKFMARPGEQFVLRREVFRRIQEAFAANGIRFAPRRVIVDTGGPPITPAAMAAAAAAAAAESTDKTDKAPDDGEHDM